MLLRDPNVESSDPVLNGFCNVYNLFSIVKEPKCFKNLYNSSYIALFLTNHPQSFQSSVTIETGISDFHKMVITVLKVFCKKKQKQKIIQYRSYKNFDNQVFQREWNRFKYKLLKNVSELIEFFQSILDKYGPKKWKCIWENNSNFAAKNLGKAIMKRSKLRNK